MSSVPDVSRLLEVRRLERSNFADAYDAQKHLVEARIDDRVGDILILTEHEPVVTLGRGAPPGAADGVDVPTFEIERGGDATYHGPGQLVAYPIIKLDEGRRDLHRYMRDLEEVVIRVLAEFDVEGHRDVRNTGVWIEGSKVCSVGVAVRRWVTWHGFALNVFTDLDAFQSFQPCGLSPKVMTRLADHASLGPGLLLIEVLIVKHFCEVFDLELPPPPPLASPDPGVGPCLPILPG